MMERTDAGQRCGVVVMAKASIPGRAKTRLVPPLDHGEAAAFNIVFLKDVFANIRAADRHASIGGYAAGGPAGSERSAGGRRRVRQVHSVRSRLVRRIGR